MNASIITIGDEILIGQIVDTNSVWIAQQLNEIGIWVSEKKSIGDIDTAIIYALQESLNHADIVIITGGLGPTKDDITKKTLADFFNTSLSFHEPTWENMLEILKVFNRTPNESHKIQCLMPENATILSNKVGTAPGMWFDYNGKVVISMPGVPFEMKYIVTNHIIPRFKKLYSTDVIVHQTIRTAGAGESEIAAKLLTFENNLPAHIKLAYLPDFGQVRLRLTARGNDEILLKNTVETYTKTIEAALGNIIYGFGEENLEMAIGRRLVEQGKIMVCAESCSGGYIGHRITQNPGASAYFTGSYVTYSYEMKTNTLGVKKETLEQFGAVSEQTVIEMLSGALRISKAAVGISISGIAGPDGGTPDKPVGTIWVAVGSLDNIKTFELHLFKERMKNIQYSTTFALNQLRLFLDDSK